MRKLVFGILVVFGATLTHTASYAKKECRVTACSWGGDKGYENNILSTDGTVGRAAVNKGQCYRCNWGGSEECAEGTVVAIKHPDYNTNYRINAFFICDDSGEANDDWMEFNPVATCEDSEVPSTAHNTEKFYAIEGTRTGAVRSSSGDSLVLGSGNDGCVMYKCQRGYEPNESHTECILSDSISCVNSGGTWANNACTCSSAKNLKPKANGAGCECISTDYSFNTTTMQCEKTKAARDRDNQHERDRQNQNKKTACENSGGVWAKNACTCDAAKNLKTEGGVCVCTDSVNYKPAPDGKSCVLTDRATLQRECEAGASTGAYWDVVNGCLCTNPQHIWRAGKCSLNPLIENCNLISGANWVNGSCVCIVAGKVVDKSQMKCVDSPETVAANLNAALQKSRNEISSASRKISSIKESFKKTVWKDEDGDFNTTRLASDSIAAVVLGTAGGLITSNVIKKNQVANGFEDINCTVGGQKVAGWGEQFRVGIQ